jgi:ribonuclease D
MIWIDTQEAFDSAMQRVAKQKIVAVDIEADSLYSYYDKVCLIQISVPGEDLIVDPLRKIDLSAFGELLADGDVVKVLHGADYDLRVLNRDFGFTVSNLIDTSVAAQLLGDEALGLNALLERNFGVKLDKSHQRADWARRPLPSPMLEYAAADTRHLIPLASLLRDRLIAQGRWEWALEEFRRLEKIRFSEKEAGDEGFRRLKGVGAFDRRALAIARDLYDWRDEMARAADRPPFKIFGNDMILEVARAKPADVGMLASIKAVSPAYQGRYGREILRIVRKALDATEESLPTKSDRKVWMPDKALDARVARLKKVRDATAKELKIDPVVLAPRHVLVAVASTRDLDQVPAMREWQKRVVGDKLLKVLGPPSLDRDH